MEEKEEERKGREFGSGIEGEGECGRLAKFGDNFSNLPPRRRPKVEAYPPKRIAIFVQTT